jgi:hypothetical protein
LERRKYNSRSGNNDHGFEPAVVLTLLQMLRASETAALEMMMMMMMMLLQQHLFSLVVVVVVVSRIVCLFGTGGSGDSRRVGKISPQLLTNGRCSY